MNPAPLLTNPATREALGQAIGALEVAQRSGQAWALAEAHLGLARAYSALGAQSFALALLEQGLTFAHGPDQRVELLCERVTALAQHSAELEAQQTGNGRPWREAARDHIFEASRLAANVADARWEVKVLLHLSDVLDRFGDRDDAVNLQTRALRLMQHPGGESAIDPSQLVSLGRLADG